MLKSGSGYASKLENHMADLSSPLISIITPYRNSEGFLAGLAANLQAQTYLHWECLLVNHASRDRGPAIANHIAQHDRRFRTMDERDKRPLPAIPRNTGLAHAHGDLICFLDVDDLWHPNKLEEQLAFHRKGKLEFSVTSYGRFRPEGGTANSPGNLPRHWRPRHPPTVMSLKRLHRDNPIPMLTVMLNQELLQEEREKEGPFSLIHHEDYLLWLTLWKERPNLRYGCLNQVLAFHRRHGSNLTGARWRMLSWTYQVYCRHGISPPKAGLLSARHALLHGTRSASSMLLSACLGDSHNI